MKYSSYVLIYRNSVPIPAASDLAGVQDHPARVSDTARGDALMVLVQTDRDIFRPERINVMLPRALLRRIDALAPNRSRFLAEAAEAKLASGT